MAQVAGSGTPGMPPPPGIPGEPGGGLEPGPDGPLGMMSRLAISESGKGGAKKDEPAGPPGGAPPGGPSGSGRMGKTGSAGGMAGGSRSRTVERTRSLGPAPGLVESSVPPPRSPGERAAKSASGSFSAAMRPAPPTLPMAGSPRSATATKNRQTSTGTKRSVRFHRLRLAADFRWR